MPSCPVFLILCHNDPTHFARLTQRVRTIGEIVAHVDAKSDLRLFKQEDVNFTERRIDVQWGGYSMIEATLELITFALIRFRDASHFVLLSGADYPMKPMQEIAEVFQNAGGHNFIKFYNMGQDPEHFWHHISKYYFHDAFGGRSSAAPAHVVRRVAELLAFPIRKKWPVRLRAAAGSQWWALTPDCCRYILRTVLSDSFWTDFWRWSFAPDELFFHSIIFNSEFFIKSDGLVDSPYQDQTANLHLIDRDLFKVFKFADLPRIKTSEKLFVRKVNTVDSKDLLDALDAKHLALDKPMARFRTTMIK